VSIPEANLCSHRTMKTRAELYREGYPKVKVDSIDWADARSLNLTGENISRWLPVTDGNAPLEDAIQEEMQKVMVYETYVRIDIHDGGGVKLWKVTHAGHMLLDKEEVDRAPFMCFVALPQPHIFHGSNFAARVIPTQNARTVLTRAILDH